jgi:hypothetical protein
LKDIRFGGSENDDPGSPGHSHHALLVLVFPASRDHDPSLLLVITTLQPMALATGRRGVAAAVAMRILQDQILQGHIRAVRAVSMAALVRAWKRTA